MKSRYQRNRLDVEYDQNRNILRDMAHVSNEFGRKHSFARLLGLVVAFSIILGVLLGMVIFKSLEGSNTLQGLGGGGIRSGFLSPSQPTISVTAPLGLLEYKVIEGEEGLPSLQLPLALFQMGRRQPSRAVAEPIFETVAI